MITAEEERAAIWRDNRMTAAEVCAVVTDPWWQTLPWEYRMAWWRRRYLLEWANTAGYATAELHLAAREEAERAKHAGEVSYDQPPAEVSTRGPRPADAPADPPAIARLVKLAHESWEVRVGYCRGFRKAGRGNVGPTSDARWELTHVVVLEARPAGQVGRGWVSCAYAAPAVEPLKWKHDGSAVPGKWKATAAEAKALLEADAGPVVAATLSATRQTVAPTTDMFAA
jgi:hypothetical protein